MKKTYYIFNAGRLSRKDNTIRFEPYPAEDNPDPKPKYIPVENTDQLYCMAPVDANSAFFNFAGKHDIAVHFFDFYENYTGSFLSKDYLLAGQLLIKQVKFHTSKKKRLQIAKAIVEGASFNILKNLKYYNNRNKDVSEQIAVIERFRETIDKATSINALMGIEGNIRNVYYTAFEKIVPSFSFGKRTKQPPSNPMNALISFGNMLCYTQVLRSIHQTQLNPTVSFLHEPGYRRYSLALDIAEIFKPLIIDRLIFKVTNKQIIKPQDFDSKLNGILLKPAAKKKFLAAYEQRLAEVITHRTLKKRVSYKHLIKLEVYKIQKHILGMEEYKPFKIWW